jgi:CHASE3 domain sensor protein
MAGARLKDESTLNASAMPGLRGWRRPERLMVLVAVLLTAAVLAIVAGIVGVAGERAAAVREANAVRAARLAINALMQASIDAEAGQRGYLLTGYTHFLEPY